MGRECDSRQALHLQARLESDGLSGSLRLGPVLLCSQTRLYEPLDIRHDRVPQISAIRVL